MHFDDIVFIVDNTFLTAKKITSEKLNTYRFIKNGYGATWLNNLSIICEQSPMMSRRGKKQPKTKKKIYNEDPIMENKQFY